MKKSKIHPSAIVSEVAKLGKNVSIGPYCIVEANVTLHDDVVLHSHAQITGNTTLGERCVVFPFSVLGGPAQDLSYCGEEAYLSIGSDTIVREHVTMHRGTLRGRSETKVGCNGYFMVGSHVAHDCVIGDNVTFAQDAVAGGHVVIGDHCTLSAKSAIHQFSNIGQFAFIGAGAMVTKDVIPFGLVHQHQAILAGLNIVGLKRHKFSREKIQIMRSAFSELFLDYGLFDARVEKVANIFSDCVEVMQIIDFIRSKQRTRALCHANEK